MDHDETVRLYGPWHPRTAVNVVDLFRGYAGPWWIAGGWAIEAFTSITRPHGDIDPSIPRTDAELLRAHLRGRYDVWAADQGILRPLTVASSVVPKTCSNLWLRASGSQPWEYDVLLTDATPAEWIYKRDARVSLPFDQILWTKDEIVYLRPEIQLLYKAPGLRPQDQQDFDRTHPLLSTTAAQWLRTALQMAHPEHPWIDPLA